MTGEQFQKLETQLWSTAYQLRPNSKLTSKEYSFPVMELSKDNGVLIELGTLNFERIEEQFFKSKHNSAINVENR